MVPLLSGLLISLSSSFLTVLAQTTTQPAPAVVASNYIISSNPNVTAVDLKVTTQDKSRQNDTAPLLYGLMFEDISHSGDGGLYAELLINRAFQGSPVDARDNPVELYGTTATGWSPIGNISIALDRLHPLSDALPTSLMVTVPRNTTGMVGVMNTGWWGMDVIPQTYNASFHVNAVNSTYWSNMTTTFTVSIRSNATDEVWAESTIGPVHVDTFRYSNLSTSIYNNATAPDGNNTFTVTFDGEAMSGQTFYFSLFSLFPETFKNRPNGLRKDLAEAYYDIKPGFLRCPGGNNIEGPTIQQRFKWFESIGPLENRPGRVGDWGYYNTGGLGLMEFLYWCEDMEMEPVLAVYAGYSLDGTSYPLEYMDEVLQEILDELEFCLGNTSTKWGAKRAEYGHPEPFKIGYVEIGNEDFFSCTYPYRFSYLYKPLTEAYPEIRFMSTAYKENANGGDNANCKYNISLPSGSAYDLHSYQTPSFYLENFDLFDNYLAINKLSDIEMMLGEYSVFQLDTSTGYVNFSDPPDIHPKYPQMIHALGEAVYQLSAERNPDLVKLTAYAPSLQNRNNYAWTPNLISFEAKQNLTVRTTSYWQEWLFGNYRGTQVVPVEGEINPLYWVGNINNSTQSFYLKIVNTGNQTVPLTITFDTTYSSVNGTTLQTDNPNAFNYINNQTAVVPRKLKSTDLPTKGGASSSTGSHSRSSTRSGSMTSGSANGQGLATSTATAATETPTGMRRRQSGMSGGGMTWSWTVPVFSSTVLQFDK